MAFDPSTVISARLDRLASIAELIYFPDDVIAEHERRPAAHRLWVEVPSDHHVRVGQARGEHAYSHLAPPGCRQRGIMHLPARQDRRSASFRQRDCAAPSWSYEPVRLPIPPPLNWWRLGWQPPRARVSPDESHCLANVPCP